jgi:hypothetical protein
MLLKDDLAAGEAGAGPGRRWYSMSKVGAGAGLSIRAIVGPSGWGHPLQFAIISYCGYAISAACLGMAAVHAVRYLSRPWHADQGPGQRPGRECELTETCQTPG